VIQLPLTGLNRCILGLLILGLTNVAGRSEGTRLAAPPMPTIHEPGFTLTIFATGLEYPTSMAFGPDGRLFVSQQNGDIQILEDINDDQVVDNIKTFADGFTSPVGLAFRRNDLYVSDRGRIGILRDTNKDDVADGVDDIVTGLPFGWHHNNGIAFGPDGKLYFGLGSTCNACDETDPRSATVMRYNPDGSGEEIFATGLRNTYDIAFHPDDGTLWGADNGMQDPLRSIPDELNLIVEGGDYGWPNCWGMGQGSDCMGTTVPVIDLEPNASADGIVFYTGTQFPASYHNNLFIAEWGSFDGARGRKVIRVVLSKEDDTYRAVTSDFITGLDRPLDVVVVPDGALLVADYSLGVIYRVAYTGLSSTTVYLPLIMRDH
jgi:glucose/arabinose dehydrogenase